MENGPLTLADHDRLLTLEGTAKSLGAEVDELREALGDQEDSHEGLKRRVSELDAKLMSELANLRVYLAGEFGEIKGRSQGTKETRGTGQWWAMLAIGVASLLTGLSGWAAFVWSLRR